MSWEHVSPEQAKIWLDNRNTRNRPKKAAAIEAFAADMVTNQWCPNHQGVAFAAEDEALIDGQNRLEAIVMSGKGQWMLVFRDVPERIDGIDGKMSAGIDRGTPRSVADMLRMEQGMKQEANVIAAACLHVARLCVPHPELQAKKASTGQTAGVLREFLPAMKWIAEARSTQHGLKQIALTGTMAFAYAVWPEQTQAFYDEVKQGGGEEGSPAMRVRFGLLHGNLHVCGGGLWDRCRAGVIILTALKAYAKGRRDWPRLPAPEECSKALDFFREQQMDRVRAVRKLFPLLGEPSRMAWPPPPKAPERTQIEHGEKGADDDRPVTTVKLTAEAERLLERAGR